jgi:3-hydroxyacyl-CoA dehydrogenase/enoyl-CoA hydratase/3-hydroxybutyryl-CoA epimerase
LPINEIAVSSGAPTRVVGLHFFNPVSRMKLIEVVVGKQTSDEVRDDALAFARQIGKLPVLVRDSPGFLVNRVLFPYLLDAAEMFQSGVGAEEIDKPLLEWGMPMGPLRLIDEIGVDITVDIAATLEKAFGRRDETPQILRRMLAEKMLGRKTGGGFYKYEGKTQTPNNGIEKWRAVAAVAGRGGSREAVEKPGSATPVTDALAHRFIFLMVNEAARCVEEGVVATPEDADYGMILGTGFPTFRGGPLRFAEQYGLKKLVDELQRLAQSEEKFTPCGLLQEHARNGTKFYAE